MLIANVDFPLPVPKSPIHSLALRVKETLCKTGGSSGDTSRPSRDKTCITLLLVREVYLALVVFANIALAAFLAGMVVFTVVDRLALPFDVVVREAGLRDRHVGKHLHGLQHWRESNMATSWCLNHDVRFPLLPGSGANRSYRPTMGLL